ncbi:MAG TPA: FAD-dependent oxidoreductase [Cytophagaceae bacterium]|jgi:glycine/D-amino acid oxidase-like deaminating enzyme/nitrite reductase/ring-hydroxylating ferredoxin subunit
MENKMNTTIKRSIWEEEANVPSFTKLIGDIDSDVVVIGGGITGVTTALLLVQSGRKVVIVEAEEIGRGTTGLSSCHLNTDLDNQYSQLYKDFDEETIKIVAQSRIEGINFIEKQVQEKNIDCDFRRVSGYWYSENESDLDEIKEEEKYASMAGLNVQWHNQVPLPFKNVGGLEFKHEAEFNSYKYVSSLLKAVVTGNCTVFENSRVTDLEEKEGKCIVSTATARITCNNVVMATHIPIFINVLQTLAPPYRSYMVTAKLNDNNYPNGLFWDNYDPYYYTRTYEKNGEKYLVVGGADHKTGTEVETEKSYRNIENYINERYSVASFEHRWSAQYYETSDGLPYIGRTPFGKNVFVATGFSGDGLVYGTIAAIIIADLINGVENKWAKVYDSTRVTPLASAKEFLKENLEVAKHFISDRFKVEDLDASQIQLGEGRIIEHQGEKVAAAKSEDGKLHVLSPVCTHMGCYVQWNNYEKSWDCPCHGSRFNMKGEVLEGPAVKALEQKG